METLVNRIKRPNGSQNRKGFACIESAMNLRVNEPGKAFSLISLGLTLMPELRDNYQVAYLQILESPGGYLNFRLMTKSSTMELIRKNWVKKLTESNQTEDALKVLDVAGDIYNGHSNINYLIGDALLRAEQYEAAFGYTIKAFRDLSFDPRVEHQISVLSENLLSRWHFPMINDQFRNEAYKIALQNCRCKTSVLDIGSGSGLLGLFAKEAGFNAIYACESSNWIYELCSGVFEENHVDDIVLLNECSTDLKIGTHLPQQVKTIVTEIFDAGLFGEDCLTTIRHALTELADDDCKIIPGRADIYIYLIQCDDVASQTKGMLEIPKIPQLRLSLKEPYLSEKLSRLPNGYRILSECKKILGVDFGSLESIDALMGIELGMDVSLIEDGMVDAIGLCFELHLDQQTTINTFPGSETCWENAIYPVFNRIPRMKGETLPVEVRFDEVLRLEVPRSIESFVQIENPLILRCLNSSCYRDFYETAAGRTMDFSEKIRSCDSTLSSDIMVLDATPFPVAGIYCLSRNPNVKLFVKNEEVLKILRDIPNVFSMEDFTGVFDAVFLWPITAEGSFDVNILAFLETTKKLIHENTIVFPGIIKYNLEAIKSQELLDMSRVPPSTGSFNLTTLNLVQTRHQLDTPLGTLPHTPVSEIVTPLKIYTDSGLPETTVLHGTRLEEVDSLLFKDSSSLQRIRLCLKKTSTEPADAFAYWFTLCGSPRLLPLDFSLADISLDTTDKCSPVYQAMILPDRIKEVNGFVDVSFNYSEGFISISSLLSR